MTSHGDPLRAAAQGLHRALGPAGPVFPGRYRALTSKRRRGRAVTRERRRPRGREGIARTIGSTGRGPRALAPCSGHDRRRVARELDAVHGGEVLLHRRRPAEDRGEHDDGRRGGGVLHARDVGSGGHHRRVDAAAVHISLLPMQPLLHIARSRLLFMVPW